MPRPLDPMNFSFSVNAFSDFFEKISIFKNQKCIFLLKNISIMATKILDILLIRLDNIFQMSLVNCREKGLLDG